MLSIHVSCPMTLETPCTFLIIKFTVTYSYAPYSPRNPRLCRFSISPKRSNKARGHPCRSPFQTGLIQSATIFPNSHSSSHLSQKLVKLTEVKLPLRSPQIQYPLSSSPLQILLPQIDPIWHLSFFPSLLKIDPWGPFLGDSLVSSPPWRIGFLGPIEQREGWKILSILSSVIMTSTIPPTHNTSMNTLITPFSFPSLEW